MGMIELEQLYQTDKRFKEYVDKYAACHRTTEEVAIKDLALDALSHAVVKNYAEYLIGGTHEKIS